MWNNYLLPILTRNNWKDYAIAAGIIVGGIVIAHFVFVWLFRHLKAWAKRTQTTFDDWVLIEVERALPPLLYFTVFAIGMKSLHLTPAMSQVLRVAALFFFTFIVLRLVSGVARYLLLDFWPRRQGLDPQMQKQVRGLFPILSVTVWLVGGLFLLDNLGVNIRTVATGLGIGGVALALASQTVLADMFSYFAILFDQPFALDDFIVVGNYMGTVEHIGIKTTRIRSLSGEQLIFSNKDLTDSRIQNFKRMQTRRVVFQLGFTYDTPTEKLKKIPGIIEGMIKGMELARFDRAHFSSFGESALMFEVVYFILSDDYNKYMDVQQALYFMLKERFEQESIEFAFPTRTVHLTQTPATR